MNSKSWCILSVGFLNPDICVYTFIMAARAMFWQKTEQFIAQTTPAQNIPGASSALCSFPWQVPLLHGKKPQSYHLHLQRKNIFASLTCTKVNLCYLGGLKSPKRALAPAATCNRAMVSRLWNSFDNLTQELHKTNLTNISTLKHKFSCNEASFCPRTMWKMLEFPTSTSFQQTKSRILAVSISILASPARQNHPHCQS